MRVSAPDGREWAVSRRWVGRKVALRWVRLGGLHDALDPAPVMDTSVSGILLGVALMVALVLVVVFVLPLLILLAQILVILVLVAAGAAGRALFRRPWEVDAVTEGPPAEAHVWRVVGWRNSGEAIREATDSLRRGMIAASPGGAVPVPGQATPGPTPSRSIPPPASGVTQTRSGPPPRAP